MSTHKNQPQGSQYDRIWRENMQVALPGIIEKVLKITVVQSRDLPDKVQITKQREVDVLQEVLDEKGARFILHVEIQVRDDPDMVYRMAEYRIMLERQYRIPVRQFVVYIGSKKSKMSSVLDLRDLYFEYSLVNLCVFSYKLFLSSDRPEEQILSILGDLEGEEAEDVISIIIQKVRRSSQGDLSEGRYWQQLRTLIQLRNLTEQFDHAMEKVSTFFKEEKDPLFLRGVKKGKEEGIEEGIEQGFEQGVEQGLKRGIEQGREEKDNEVVRNLIVELGLSDKQAAKVAGVAIEFVRKVRTSLAKK